MNKLLLLATVAVVIALSGCTHASISSVPFYIEGIGEVYRYEGRANFSHQMKKADEMMLAACKERNGGSPIVIDLQKRDLGTVALGQGQANTTFNATTIGNSTYGTANTTAYGSGSGLRNQNQEILFRCVVK